MTREVSKSMAMKQWTIQLTQAALAFVRSGYWAVPLIWGFLVIYMSPRFGWEYSPDSYAYFLLGNNLLSGLGYVSQAVRDFHSTISGDFFQPSQSFPPMFPVLAGIMHKLTGEGIGSGLMVNIFVLLAMLHVFFHFAKIVGGKYHWAVFVIFPYFIVMSDSPSSMVAEIVSGRSIPLAGLIFLGLCALLCRQSRDRPSAVLIGVLLAALYLTRYDTLVFCVFLIVYLAIDRPNNIRWVAIGFFAAIAPWMIRNSISFGRPLASDNFLTAVSTYQSIIPIAWFEGGVPTLSANPNLWATQRVSNLLQNLEAIHVSLAPFGGLAAVAVALYGLLSKSLPPAMRRIIAVSWLWVVANLTGVSLTPFHDNRYFSLSVLAISLSALLTILAKISAWESADAATENQGNESASAVSQRIQTVLTLICLGVATAIGYYFVKGPLDAGDRYAVDRRCYYDQFNKIVSGNDPVAFVNADMLAYYSTWRTIYLPINLGELDGAFMSWAKAFNVRYAIMDLGWDISKYPGASIKAQACGASLVELETP